MFSVFFSYTKHKENLYIHSMTWHALKWNTNFHSEIICSHFSSEHTTHCASVHWKCNNIWDVGKCHTCYIVIFYFLLNKVDSVSAAAVASILSSTSSNWNNSFQIFLTSPICHVSEFHLETGGPRLRYSNFCNWIGLWRCLGRNVNWWQYCKLCLL